MNSETRKKLVLNAAAQSTRCRMSLQIPHTIPIDPIFLAEKCDCDVRLLSLASLEGMYSTAPRPTILIGSQRPAGRRNFTCAHELAHHVFKHGTKIDELKTSSSSSKEQKPEEFLADAFAGYLLMPQLALTNTIRQRGWSVSSLHPEQAYILASYFGVGYSTIINHLRWSLNMLNCNKADELLETSPKMIKSNYGAMPDQEIIFVDFLWQRPSVDVEVGDILILPSNAEVDANNQISFFENKEKNTLWKASAPGYARAFCKDSDWAVNIRISRKDYEGLAGYRFYTELEEDKNEC